MKRRNILKIVSSSIMFGGAPKSLGSSVSNLKCKLQFKCRSKIYPNKKYETAAEFWIDHDDPEVNKINTYFNKLGWLTNKVSSSSNLMEDQQTVLVNKTYRSKLHQRLYSLAYKRLKTKKTTVDFFDIRWG